MPQSDQKQRVGQFAGKVEQTLGIIAGTKLWTPFPFAGLNLQDTEPSIDDKEFTYCENFFRLGNGYLRTAWDVGGVFYTAPVGLKIIYFFWFNIGEIDYVAVFLSDGTAVQVQQSNSAVTPISLVANTFYRANGNFPICSQSGTQYLLIANNNSQNDYWIWDGALLYSAGTLSPFVDLLSGGSNYSSPPTITAFGGTGTGATFSSTVLGGSVNQVNVTNPGSGYSVGDIVQLAFTGGGSDTSAELTASLASGGVAGVTISATGINYTSAPTVSFTGGGGTGAAATASISGGVVSIGLGAGGSGYTSPPSVTLTGGGGTGATAHATVSGGAVTGFVVDAAGSGYTSPPSVVIGGPGTGASGTAVINEGVTGIVVTNPGTGYTSAPTVGFTGGAGTGAAATAQLGTSGVLAIAVTNPGSGFTSVPLLTIEGGGGAGATAIAVLTGTSVGSININAGGSGYYHTPTVTIAAPDSGVTATATATVSNGRLVAITLTNAGSGYTAVPAITITPDGSDTGATGAVATATLTATTIGSVIVTAAGTGYTSAPAVLVSAGANHAAYATVSLVPFGVNGNTLETFNSRVWLGDQFQTGTAPTGGDFIFSAASSLTDFSTSGGGGTFTSTDRFLRKHYTGIRQSNGYLYFFGDSSVAVVSNINTTGSPAVTTFNYQNVDPQVGMAYRDSIQDFGRTIVFSNETGVWGLYGGAATKISKKLDRLFATAIFPPTAGALRPSSAVGTVFNVKYHFFLCTMIDPELGTTRNVMVGWNEQEWGIFSQSKALTFIGTQEINGEPLAWGTDGTSIYPLFSAPSTQLTKRLSTKMYGSDNLLLLKDFLNLYVQAQDLSGGGGINMTTTMVASGVAAQPGNVLRFDAQSVVSTVFASASYADMLFQQPSFDAAPPYYPLFGTGTGGLSFSTLTIRFTTQSPDFALANTLVAYQDNTAYQ